MINLSVVVLCFHSFESINDLFNELKTLLEEMQIEYEIILVANDFEDSNDKTASLVKSIERHNPRVKAITRIKKGMMGWDMLQGIDASTGTYICVIDGDGQFPFDSIKKTWQLMLEKSPDIVKTYRMDRDDGMRRWLISRAYNIIFMVLFPGLKIRDVNSKPKLISREAYSKLKLTSTDWFIDAEIMIRARDLKMQILEIPVHFSGNTYRKSFVKTGAIIEFMINLVKFRFHR